MSADPQPDLTALFEQARSADIAAVAGVALRRAGRELRGECPLCGASKRRGASGAFAADPARGLFFCHVCEAGGDVIRLERLLRGGSLRDAAERLAGPAPRSPQRPAPPKPRAEPAPAPAAVSHTAVRLWRDARGAHGTPAEGYLRRRGISGAVLAPTLKRLRYHPAAIWGFDERGSPIHAPAMVARVDAPTGPTGGVHVTYLTPDGRKARLDPARRMWGPQIDAGGRPGGAWLIPRATEPGAPLIVAEGIETALSAAQLYGRPCRVVAALALNRLQGGWLADRWGRVDPDLVRGDPERPAFTWPQPTDDPWPQVMIAVDRDMAPLKVKVRRRLGGTTERTIDGEARARICAGLAIAAWRATGVAQVRAIAPAAGADFNDQLRRVG